MTLMMIITSSFKTNWNHSLRFVDFCSRQQMSKWIVYVVAFNGERHRFNWIMYKVTYRYREREKRTDIHFPHAERASALEDWNSLFLLPPLSNSLTCAVFYVCYDTNNIHSFVHINIYIGIPQSVPSTLWWMPYIDLLIF